VPIADPALHLALLVIALALTGTSLRVVRSRARATAHVAP